MEAGNGGPAAETFPGGAYRILLTGMVFATLRPSSAVPDSTDGLLSALQNSNRLTRMNSPNRPLGFAAPSQISDFLVISFVRTVEPRYSDPIE